MPFIHDSTGVSPSGGYTPLPEGEYALVIKDATEKMSKKGLPMIEVALSVIEHPEFHGKTFKHWVVFIPKGEKGDGMSVHFRKCIGIPYGGADEIDARDWIDKKLRAKLKIESKPGDNGKTFTSNKMAEIMPYGNDFPTVKSKEETVPF